ncbi:O-antigen ligase family protein [Bacillus cereus]|uniref:O-antigen ligase-related domain-containing protein n=4 Tax=Bacillus TaxID=1386 RepID=A0A9X7B0Y5_BACTU|nr:O-antigen ligase family protein [Bacillus cereus]PFT95327.1 hypothetical protein COK81_11585 [Bacillus thuringiensis]MCQ6285454.1 O-antigen ligase family protein [Bacillus cereus]MCQ6314180.1 O-antigen ligase family protein [Bacillus cereus]MCQ6382381.1 O-antigen ligase family protein [Bacillus cereus]PFV33021.1 hypothetical protein COK99_09580 [Bacillus thuringiensis]
MLILRFFSFIYLTLLLFLVTYQDFFLVNKIGEIGRSPIFLLLPFFIIGEILNIKCKKINITKLQKYLFMYIIYVFCVGLIYVFIYSLKGVYVYLNEDIFLKFVKGQMYFIIIFLFYRHCYLLFSIIKTKVIFRAFFVNLMILNIIMAVEYFSMPSAWMWLHSSDEPYYRIRLLTVESSWTGTIYLIYSILTLYLAKKLFNNFKVRLYTITIIISLLAYVFLTGSKGFFIVFVVSLIFFAFNFINIFRISVKNIIFSFLLLCCTALVFMILKDDFYSSLMSDIEKYTSVSTRLGLFMVAIKVFVTNPFGVGTGVYIVLLVESIQGIIELLREIFVTLFNVSPNLDELQRLTGTTKGLAIKSSFFNWLVQGGIGALLYFFYSSKVANQITKNDKMLRFCLIFVLISVFSFINLEIKYEIWLFFAFIDWNYHNNKPHLNGMP